MIDSKLVQFYYKKFLPKELDIFGLKFYSSMTDDFGISWRMENPNDLSYNVEVLKGYLEDKVTHFMKFTGKDISKPDREKLTQFNHKPLFYLNQQDENEIKKHSDSINEINFADYKIPIKIKKIKFIPGYDYINMEVNCVINEIYTKTKDSKGKIWLHKLDKDESRKVAIDLYHNDDFSMEYLYDLMNPVTRVIWSNPTVVNTEYIFFEINLGFYDNNGEFIG